MNSEARAGALPAYQGPVGGPGRTPPFTACTFSADYIHEATQNVIMEIEKARSLSVLAEPICRLGIAFDKVSPTDYYQAWIDPDAKVTFTVQNNKVYVYCAETITYSDDKREQERCALRSLVRSYLEDPEKLTAINAVVEILNTPRVRRYNEACKMASQMARNMGITAPQDDVYEASIKLVKYYVENPDLIPEMFETVNAYITARARKHVASSSAG